jgi:type II secretory ATPase GspE/PulE/Tfp pilus assembly ATPase PilB-like protein
LERIHDKKSARPSVSLANFNIASNLQRKIPEATARSLSVAPLATEDEALIVACSATPDAATQAELNRLAGMRVVAVIATADEISVKQNELYRSRTVDTANGHSSDAEKQPVADPDSSDSSVARLFENEEPIELVEHSELGSERALLLVAQRMLAAAMQGGVLDIHVETEAGKRRTNISFRRVPDSGTVQNSL